MTPIRLLDSKEMLNAESAYKPCRHCCPSFPSVWVALFARLKVKITTYYCVSDLERFNLSVDRISPEERTNLPGLAYVVW